MKKRWSSQQVVATLCALRRTSSSFVYVRIHFWFRVCFDARILFVLVDNRRMCVLMPATHSLSECHQYVWHDKGLWELIKVTDAWRALRSNLLSGLAMFVSWWLQNMRREGRSACWSSEVSRTGLGVFQAGGNVCFSFMERLRASRASSGNHVFSENLFTWMNSTWYESV